MVRTKTPNKIQVETWLIKDRIHRYRGVLKLHTRDKKLQLSQATKLKSLVSRKLTSLDVDVKRHREVLNDLSDDGKWRILKSLGDHREFYLAFDHLKLSETYAALHQDCDVKRRLLDKLYYEKKRKLKQGIELQLEHNVLSIEFEEQSEDLSNCQQQQLIARLQQSVTKHNAANAIYFTYCSMLNILKKDATFFDILLNNLKEDQILQCKTMLKVTVMGQLAAENLDDIRQKYKRMTRAVLRNMRIREQMLSTVRCQVDDLWTYAQSLVRVESNHVFATKDIDKSSNKIFESQLTHLQDVCDKVRETFLVRSYYDLHSRLQNQSQQKIALLTRLDTNLKNRDLLWSKKNYALHVLESLDHSTKTTVEQYTILEQIEIEKKREKDLKEQKKICGELLTNIRAALQNMNTMLLCIKHSVKGAKKLGKDGNKNTLKEPITVDDKEDAEDHDTLPELEKIDTDVLVLLSKISRKIGILFGMSNFDLESDKEAKARDLYQTYVSNCSSNLIFGTGKEEPIGLLVEHETVDITVPTRVDIKLRSKQIIETHLKLE
ncbi:outer dynein arm-docking complex subunit 3-like [Linepithema humile]|uniref:outer dynein arm-docking complex subunit 3-like n=1 Tax=Linepithema humile TaxID=83485 RepID=UPI00351F570B